MKKKNKKQSFEDKLLVYGAYLQVATSLQHSNRIQLTYKMITSTWVIATFIGAGYSLSSAEVNLPLDPLLLVPIFCVASTFVILLIWYLDLIVQEKNIASAVSLGLQLEKENPWLPQPYHNIAKLHFWLGYILMKSSFYLGVITILSITITASIGYYLYLNDHILWIFFSSFSLLIIPVFFIFFNQLTKKSDPYHKLKNNH